ncbi:MAG TPA: YceI family protein [Bryobacteraceae bacterium]|nr:YceI family protein [Bryobacteraceae bacterium]
MSTATTAATAVTYAIDSSHSSVSFKIRHCMVAYFRGEFTGVTGDVAYDPANPADTKIAAVIDATTFYTRDERRDAHVKGAEFLNVEKYPVINFTSKQVTPSGKNQWKITGDLTMHGVTQEVTLDVESAGTEAKDPRGNLRTGASATTTIQRGDFGLALNVPLETGGLLLSDEVRVDLEIELIRKQ